MPLKIIQFNNNNRNKKELCFYYDKTGLCLSTAFFFSMCEFTKFMILKSAILIKKIKLLCSNLLFNDLNVLYVLFIN